MDIAEVTAKAKVLLEALPYIQDFRGSIFVVKYGGSFMDDPDPVIHTRVAYDIAFLAAVGISVVVVHGGGKAITKAMEGSGLQAKFLNGMRVTDEATVAIVKRTLDEIVNWLLGLGYIPSFCTACYREGRTGDRFMPLAKSGQIGNFCLPNALLTFEEYLTDYGDEDLRSMGQEMISREILNVPNEKRRAKAVDYLSRIRAGERDLRF